MALEEVARMLTLPAEGEDIGPWAEALARQLGLQVNLLRFPETVHEAILGAVVDRYDRRLRFQWGDHYQERLNQLMNTPAGDVIRRAVQYLADHYGPRHDPPRDEGGTIGLFLGRIDGMDGEPEALDLWAATYGIGNTGFVATSPATGQIVHRTNGGGPFHYRWFTPEAEYLVSVGQGREHGYSPFI